MQTEAYNNKNTIKVKRAQSSLHLVLSPCFTRVYGKIKGSTRADNLYNLNKLYAQYFNFHIIMGEKSQPRDIERG